MINQITGGIVEFTRPSSYSTDKSGAKVTLNFYCADGSTDAAAQQMLDTVAAMAMAKAREMAGDKPTSFPVAPKPSDVPLPVAEPAPAAALIPLPTDELATKNARLLAAAAAALPTPVAEDPELITDKRLVDELTAKNAKLLNAAEDDMARQKVPQRLHALVAAFVPPPAKVQAIPENKRALFLAQLATL